MAHPVCRFTLLKEQLMSLFVHKHLFLKHFSFFHANHCKSIFSFVRSHTHRAQHSCSIHDICLFFSTDTIFGSIFSTQKSVNYDKKMILQQFHATKHHKLYTSFLHITDFLHISHVESFFHMIMCHMENFST